MCSTPDEFRNRRDLSLDLLQRSTPQHKSPGFTSPRSSMLGLVPPPLPIFQPSPMRSQGSSYLSPESRARRRQSDISDLQNFSLSPQFNGRSSIGENGVSEAPLSSSFAEILDGHSRISPKSFSLPGEMGRTGNMPFAQLFKSGSDSETRGNHLMPLQAGNSPLQLKADGIFGTDDKDPGSEGMAGRRRRALDFSDPSIQAAKGQGNGSLYSSPQIHAVGLEDGMDNLLPIHPLKDSSHEAPNSDGKSGEDEDCQKGSDTRFLSSRSMDTMAQSPISMRPGITRKEHLIDSPAVKEATDAAVAAAMRANAIVAQSSSPKRPQRAAAAGVAAAAAAAAGIPSKSRRSVVSHMSTESERKDVSVPSLFASSAISRFVEGENGCMKCKCKKSRCLKLYCECFKAQGYCGAGCSCSGCSNREENKDEIVLARESILSRNPHAFAEKISETFVPSQNGVVTAGPQHRKGCNCKKSKCLKKYCECYQAGIPCGDHCKCDGCHNTLQHFSSQSAKQASRSSHEARSHPLDKIGSSTYFSRNGTFASNSMQARNFLLQKNGFDGKDLSYLVGNSAAAKLALGNLFKKNREADSDLTFTMKDSRPSSAVAVSGGQFLVPIPWPLGKPKVETDDSSHPAAIDKLTPIVPAIDIDQQDQQRQT